MTGLASWVAPPRWVVVQMDGASRAVSEGAG
jgi:hypothetical protein